MNGTKISTLPTSKTDLSDQPFIKYDIFEVTVTFPPRGTHIGIVSQYCEHHDMSYISRSTNNSPWNHNLTSMNRTNLCILIIGRKSSTTVQQFMEAISSQQITVKCNNIHVVTALRDNIIVRTDLQLNRSIFDQLRHIQGIGNKLISLHTKLPTPYNIGDVVNSPLISYWYDSIFANYEKI